MMQMYLLFKLNPNKLKKYSMRFFYDNGIQIEFFDKPEKYRWEQVLIFQIALFKKYFVSQVKNNCLILQSASWLVAVPAYAGREESPGNIERHTS